MALELKRSRDTAGKVISGLWECDIVRMEKIDDVWCLQVPCREIGTTGYYEYRPLAMGGQWRTAGYRRTRAGCCIAAEKMRAGETVFKKATGSGDDHVPACTYAWADVSAEIAAHNSVSG